MKTIFSENRMISEAYEQFQRCTQDESMRHLANRMFGARQEGMEKGILVARYAAAVFGRAGSGAAHAIGDVGVFGVDRQTCLDNQFEQPFVAKVIHVLNMAPGPESEFINPVSFFELCGLVYALPSWASGFLRAAPPLPSDRLSGFSTSGSAS